MKYVRNLFTKQAILTGLLVICLVVLFGYSSYALFMRVDRYDPIQAMSFGDLGVSFATPSISGITNHIALRNVSPMNDVEATKASYDGNKYSFALTNYGIETSDYKVYLLDLTNDDLSDANSSFMLNNMIDHKYIRVQVDDGTIYNLSSIEDGLICSGEVKYGEENIVYHSVRIWLSNTYPGSFNNLDLKLVFASKLQSENIKNNSLTYQIIKDNGSDTISDKSYDINRNETGDNSGLFYNTTNQTYFYRGVISNNNLIFGKDSESNDIMWKIISVSYNQIRIVLNNNTMIKTLKTNYGNMDITLSNWFSKFDQSSYDNIIKSINNKKYSTLTYDELMLAGLAPGNQNSAFYLATKINYWATDSQTNYFFNNETGANQVTSDNAYYVLPVLTIDGNVKYLSGSGTESEPYRFNIIPN